MLVDRPYVNKRIILQTLSAFIGLGKGAHMLSAIFPEAHTL